MRERDPPVERHVAQPRLAEIGTVGQDRVVSLDALATKCEATIALGFDTNQCETGDTHV